jgi:2-hydroxy-3-keto-5-methylthiopentenyl-1-phosphate phosphatase
MDTVVSVNIKKSDYASIVNESKLIFRDGFKEILHLSQDLDLPFLIVSGGVKEIIQSSLYSTLHNGELESKAMLDYCLNNIEILSNTFKYHNDEYAVDYEEPLIHILNKQHVIYDHS